MIHYIIISGVTILLSLTVFSQVVADHLPATSDALPLLGNHPMVTAMAACHLSFVYVKPTFNVTSFTSTTNLKSSKTSCPTTKRNEVKT